MSLSPKETGGVLQVIMTILSKEFGPERRASACYSAGSTGYHEFLKPLLIAVNDADRVVSFAAASALLEIKSRKVTRDLIRIIRHGTKWHNRYSACVALMGLEDSRARRVLIAVVDDIREDAQIRGMAAEALGRLPRRLCSMNSLVKALGDPAADVRFGALCGISGFAERPPDELHRVIAGLVNDETRASGTETVGQRALEVLESFERLPS
jgi:HEAT repeat protein